MRKKKTYQTPSLFNRLHHIIHPSSISRCKSYHPFKLRVGEGECIVINLISQKIPLALSALVPLEPRLNLAIRIQN